MNVQSGNRATAKRRRGRPLVDDKRARILTAALKTFADRGFHGTAVPEVAEAAGVGTGTLYRYFENKEALVNEVYRDAKTRLRDALLTDLPDLGSYKLDLAERWFTEVWGRLAVFARSEPDAFRFLEMQDHAPYLDHKSKQLELSVLAPLWMAGKRLRTAADAKSGSSASAPTVDVLIALLWGAFVGLVKAGRLGYLEVNARVLDAGGRAAWRMIAPQLSPVIDSDRPTTRRGDSPHAVPPTPSRATTTRATLASRTAVPTASRATTTRAALGSQTAVPPTRSRATTTRATLASRTAVPTASRATTTRAAVQSPSAVPPTPSRAHRKKG